MSAQEQQRTIFQMLAQVYALDKNQKWSPLTQDIITVSFIWNEQTGVTRLFGQDDKGTVIVNSTILPNMAYRRPSDTFVQWFDSQHILFGLNLTSTSDAEAFEREFEIATGKRGRKPKAGSSSPSPSQKLMNYTAAVATAASTEKTTSPALSTTTANVNGTGATVTNQSANATDAKEKVIENNMPADNKSELGQNATSTTQSIKLLRSDASQQSLSDMKQMTQLKARIKELELQNVTLEAEKSSLNETIASQTKTISGLNTIIKQLEADIDKLKAAFQQNASNVSIWKQQLQTYQEVNEQLSRKTTELAELYERFGEILRRD